MTEDGERSPPRPAPAPRPTTAGDLLHEGRGALAHAPFDLPGREAGLLLRHLLGLSEAALLAHPERLVEPPVAELYRHLLERRIGGEPVAYLLEEKEFFGRSFHVDRRVLVPRPETEHLVETVLALGLPPRAWILDLGTGSGCVAVTLALELPQARLWATDCSLGALAVAAKNARLHGVEDRIRWVAADWLSGLDPSAFDLLVSNPPYIPTTAASELSREILDHEPAAAVFAGEQGLDAYRRLLDAADGAAASALLALELGDRQHEAVTHLASRRGWSVLDSVKDYSGTPRVMVLGRPGGGRGSS